MPEDGLAVGASADLPDLRQGRLLRLVAEPARQRARRESGHPIISSMEPGEDWSYCFEDDVAFVVDLEPPA